MTGECPGAAPAGGRGAERTLQTRVPRGAGPVISGSSPSVLPRVPRKPLTSRPRPWLMLRLRTRGPELPD